ncbi:hypothetical protein ACHAXS_013196 [Conticribra weissflogii]
MNSGQPNNHQQQQQQGQGDQGLPNIGISSIGFDASNDANKSNGTTNGFGTSNNRFGMQPNFSSAAAAPMNSALSSAGRAPAAAIGNADLQQALLQSLASSSSATSHTRPSPLFAGSSGGINNAAPSPSGLSTAQMSLVQQMLGKMSGGGAAGQGAASSPLQLMERRQQQPSLLQQEPNHGQGQLQGQLPQLSHQGQRQQQSPLLQQQQRQQVQPNSNQESMISQLIASLQAQQQSQQQAQVQAAIARAFGPNGGGNPSLLGPGGAVGSSGHGALNHLQGFSGSAVTGLSGTSAAIPSTQDLLSRMQLAQAAVSNSMSGSTGSGSQGVGNNNLGRNANPTPGSLGNNDVSSRTSGSSLPAAPMDVTKAGAEELIKLQMEQQRHNFMIQMAQADRQERAVLANHEAMMKKQQKLVNGSTVGYSGSSLGGAQEENSNFASVNNSSQVNNIFSTAATAAFQNPILHSNLSSTFASKMPSIVNPNANFNSIARGTSVAQNLGVSKGAAVIVPCRARGMPVDHNFKTAYFIIPEGIEHGDELMCSYPACRQAGVKFRYCLHCKVPVAKRNFRNRHRHGVPGGEGESGSDDDRDENLSSDEEDDNNDNSAAKVAKASDNPTTAATAVAASTAPFCMPTNQDDSMSGGKNDKQEHIIVIPADSGKMKKKKKSGNTRVPCRARGMPMAHNFKTAYFTIPPNIQHGDELLCSFPTCRSAGAKFRYCLHCKVPVAKRNFRNRHKHGNIGEKKKSSPKNPEDSSQEDNEEEEKFGRADNDESNEVKKEDEHQESDEDDGDLKPSSSPSTEQLEEPRSSLSLPNQDQDDRKPAASPENDIGRPQGRNLAEPKATVSIHSTHHPDKVQAWVSLLESKPDPSDRHAMAIWMMNLMSSTELTGGPASAVQSTPTVPAAASPSANTPTSQETPVKRASSRESEVSEDRRPPKKKFKKEWEDL